MKGAARLTLFYIMTFVFFLGACAAFSIVRAWAIAASAMPPTSFSMIAVGISSLTIGLPFAVYVAILSSFGYSSRHEIGRLLSATLIFLLSAVMLFGLVYGSRRIVSYGAVETGRSESSVQAPGSVAVVRFKNGSAVALVGDVAVVAESDAPLRIAGRDEGPEYGLRSDRKDPFGPSLAVPPSLANLASVFLSAGRRLEGAATFGFFPLVAYILGLSFLLASFRFLAGTTRWPLADFVLCAVALRGVAAYDDFLASAVVRRLLAELIGGVPAVYYTPIALAAVGLAVTLGAALAAIAGGRRKDNA